MSLISLNEVSFRYGAHVLLEGACLHIEQGDRLAVIGRNGCGKTTLLKIISGIIKPDDGLVERRGGVRTAYLPQEVPVGLRGSVYSAVAVGLGEAGKNLARYRELLPLIEGTHTKAEQEEFDALLHNLNEAGAWRLDAKVAETLEKLELSASPDVSTLSAGLKRRVLLGRELVSDPDILILDEPTNHLDIDSVLWLEKFLKACGKTLVFVSHDRAFLQSLSTRVAEVDRGRIISFPCDFQTFMRRRDELLQAEERNNAVFDKKLAQEEAWLRQGVKARRTRNEGRVRDLMKLRAVRSARRTAAGQASIRIQDAESSGQKVLDVKNISVAYGGRKIIDGFSTTIYAGDKIGVIGRNGAGKTTLLNALLGKIKLDDGEVEQGTKLQVAYFDQLRQTLKPKMRPFEFVGEGADFVTINGNRQNVMGYLQNFLFSPEQIRGEIAMLSGGEKNRLMLAKLFTNPANVLVLDEPTNDLDVETLELLESTLVEFSGTILLVSHDRTFLNNIVSGALCFDGDGSIAEIVGGYDEWEKFRAQNARALPQQPAKPKPVPQKKKEKFTNRERAELEQIPEKIAEVEARQAQIAAKLQDADFIRQNAQDIPALQDELSALQKQDEELFERWNFLEERRTSLEG